MPNRNKLSFVQKLCYARNVEPLIWTLYVWPIWDNIEHMLHWPSFWRVDFGQFLGWLWKVRNVFKVWKSVWFTFNPVERVSNHFWISLTKFRWFELAFLDLLIWPLSPFQLFLALLARKWSVCLLNINAKNQTLLEFHRRISWKHTMSITCTQKGILIKFLVLVK